MKIRKTVQKQLNLILIKKKDLGKKYLGKKINIVLQKSLKNHKKQINHYQKHGRYLKVKSIMFSLKKKIALSLNDDKRIESIALIEAYAYRMRKNVASEKEKIKYTNNDIKLINFDDVKKNRIQIANKFVIIHTEY